MVWNLRYSLFFISYVYVVNGNWGAWGEYGVCYKSCGGGIKERFRSCDNPPPQHGGLPCKGFNKFVSVCNTQHCPGEFSRNLFLVDLSKYYKFTTYGILNVCCLVQCSLYRRSILNHSVVVQVIHLCLNMHGSIFKRNSIRVCLVLVRDFCTL